MSDAFDRSFFFFYIKYLYEERERGKGVCMKGHTVVAHTKSSQSQVTLGYTCGPHLS